MKINVIEKQIKCALNQVCTPCVVSVQGDYIRVYSTGGVFTATDLSLLSGISGLIFICCAFDETNIYALFRIEVLD